MRTLLLAILVHGSWAAAADCDAHLRARFSDQFIRQIYQRDSVQRPEFRAFEIVPQVVLFQFDRQAQLTRAFVRMQEHYESPRFRNQIFSRKEFREWYRTTRAHGRFSYYSDWSGFNFPSRVARTFLDGEFKNQTAREKEILSVLRPLADAGLDFYVIGTYRDDEPDRVSKDELETIRHELAHALFYLDPAYRRQALRIVRQIDPDDYARAERTLILMGYTQEVMDDEIHAYLLTDLDEFTTKRRPELRSRYEDLAGPAAEIERLFERRLKNWVRTRAGTLF